jgi:hypothetical protein
MGAGAAGSCSSSRWSNRERITAAEPEELLQWSKRILSAETAETIFH